MFSCANQESIKQTDGLSMIDKYALTDNTIALLLVSKVCHVHPMIECRMCKCCICDIDKINPCILYNMHYLLSKARIL